MVPNVRFLGLPTPLFVSKELSVLERPIVAGGMGSALLETLAFRCGFVGRKIFPLLEELACIGGKSLPRLERFAGGGTVFATLEVVCPGGSDSTCLETSVGTDERARLLLEMFSFRTLCAACGTGLGVPLLLYEPSRN